MQKSRQYFCQHLRENVEWDIWTTLSANSPIWLVEYAKFKQPKMLFNIFETGRVNLVCGICQIQTTKDVCPFLEGCVPYSDIDDGDEIRQRCFCYTCMWTRLMGDGGCFGLLLSRSPPSLLPHLYCVCMLPNWNTGKGKWYMLQIHIYESNTGRAGFTVSGTQMSMWTLHTLNVLTSVYLIL